MTPIAYIPAVPGWRAITITVNEDVPATLKDGFEFREVRISVHRVGAWAITIRQPERSDFLGALFGSAFDRFGGLFGGSENVKYVPVCEGKEIDRNLHRLVPPSSEETDGQLIEDTREKIRKNNETHKKVKEAAVP